jgi:hypothetical protein
LERDIFHGNEDYQNSGNDQNKRKEKGEVIKIEMVVEIGEILPPRLDTKKATDHQENYRNVC